MVGETMKLGPSCRLAAVLIGVCAIGVGLVIAFLPWLVALPFVAIMVWRLAANLALHAFRRSPAALVALRCEREGVSYQLCSGAWIYGDVLRGGLVTPWLLLARLRDADQDQPRRRVLIVLPDMLPQHALRRLRVYLKWWHGLLDQAQ
ncbi:MAG: hypothetical protein FJY56_07645 [Betaproteobacteria bacterium]|nr:hypothetical protein [Betaproteobacteria bacterium]